MTIQATIFPARNTDPHTSHLAAAEMIASGAQGRQQLAVLAAVRVNGYCTSAELARVHGLDRYAVARRLPELERMGLVQRAPARICKESGRPAMTWREVTNG